MHQQPNRFEQRLELLLSHCKQQKLFAATAPTKLRTLISIYDRQRGRLLLEVAESSPRWCQLMNTQREAIRQLDQANRHEAEALFARQDVELLTFDMQTGLNR